MGSQHAHTYTHAGLKQEKGDQGGNDLRKEWKCSSFAKFKSRGNRDFVPEQEMNVYGETMKTQSPQ